MRNRLALVAVVDQVAEVATVTVHGSEFGPAAYSRLRDDLLWVAAMSPQRLVLDLGASDRFTGQLITVIAAARQKLPVGCLLEIRSGSPVVRNLLELAGWPSEGARARRAPA
jgi:hypothetical protein